VSTNDPDQTPVPTATATPASAALVLQPPAPVAVVAPDAASSAVPLAPDETAKLDGQVAQFIEQVTSLDIHSSDFKARVDAISTMGDDDVRQAASMSNRMLERPVNAMNGGLFDGASPVSKSLLDLRQTIEKLDPSRQGDLFAPRKLLGMIPMGSHLLSYFDSYRSAQSHLNAIIESLYHSKDALQQDNAAIEQEKVRMWALMQRLEQFVYLGKKIDAALSAKVNALDTTDAPRAKILREDVLFYARQKVTDLLTQMAVNVQGYLALDLIKKNNVELIKGVDRATTTTISALRTAIIVAQALANEKLVLDQITALNTTTGNLIASTAQMLRQQTAKVYDQAASATIDIAQLQHAFDDIYATMDAVSDYKTKALVSMQQTVDALSTQVDKAKTYLDRTRADTARETIATLDTSAPADGVVKLMPNG
jgi:uncharacterized protein YaaN involved in tellurite resistance